MAYCINCGRELADDFDFCPECGERAHPDAAYSPFSNSQYDVGTIICPQCREVMPADAVYCLNCGYRFNNAEPAVDFDAISKSIRKNAKLGSDRRKKWIAMLLCIFFGWLGAHRFYEGKIVSGVVWLFTFGCVGAGWLFDIFYTAMTPSYRLWKYG